MSKYLYVILICTFTVGSGLAGGKAKHHSSHEAQEVPTVVPVKPRPTLPDPGAEKVSAMDQTISRAAKKLLATQDDIALFVSDFDLKIINGQKDGGDFTAKGKAWLSNNKRYRVAYYQPEEQLLISNGTRRWLYLKKLNQVQVQQVGSQSTPQELFLQMGGGLAELIRQSEVELARQPNTYMLTSKNPTHYGFEKAVLQLDSTTRLPQHLIVYGPKKVEVKFYNTQAYTQPEVDQNPDYDLNTLFGFDPPETAEIIDLMW